MSMHREVLLHAGVDYEGGLRRFAGKEELYEKYLSRFLEDTHVEAAETALKQNDFQKILEEMHTLKGESGTLGLDRLFSGCNAMLTFLRSGTYEKEQVAEKLKDIRSEFDLIVEKIRQALL